VCESLRVHGGRTIQRQILNLGELSDRQRHSWRHTIDIILYDLTSTYFEGDAEAIPKARRGYSRDKRPDCKQLVIALVVSVEGLPLTYEIFPGNTVDVTTLKDIVQSVEAKHGRARRVWVFDRGINSEQNLEWLRERGACYLVGTPKSELSAFERRLTEQDWQQAAPKVEVLAAGGWATLKKGDWRKGLVASLIRERSLVDNGWVCERLHMGARNAVSRTISQCRNQLKTDRTARQMSMRIRENVNRL